MKAALFALPALAILPAISLQAQTKSPFVETTTLTFSWGMASTYVSETRTDIPTLPDFAVFDPASLPSGFETYTYVAQVLPYSGVSAANNFKAGENRHLITLLLQRLIRNGVLSKDEINKATFLSKWQFIAVREVPSTVKEMATNPYRVFLTVGGRASPEIAAYGQEPVVDDPVPDFYFTELGTNDSTPESSVITLDTGISITLGQYNGNYTEKFAQSTTYPNPTVPAEGSNVTPGASNTAWVRSASGSVVTAFRVDFGALFYDDPVFNQNDPKTDPYNYNLKRNYWQASASGYINYGIRSVAGPLPTFLASTSTATATGWFKHDHSEYKWNEKGKFYEGVSGSFYGGTGTAPLKITLSPIQYQKRTLFELDIPAAPQMDSGDNVNVTSNFGTVGSGVQVSWNDLSFNETGFSLERRDGDTGDWTEIVRPDRNTTSFTDADAPIDTVCYYRIASFNGGGQSEYSTEISVVTVAMPTNLRGVPTDTDVTLTWDDNSTIETGYEVQRLQKAGQNGTPDLWETIATLDPDTTTYTDTGLKASTVYTYRVRALGDQNNSAFSDVLAVTTKSTATNTGG